MPPFPGMNPYLESVELWHNLHHALITCIAGELNQTLPQGFAAEMEEQVYLLPPQDSLYPDVAIVRRPSSTPNFASAPNPTAGAVALAPSPSLEIRAEPQEIHTSRVRVVTTRGRREVVAFIEVLSPTNKEGEGREEYWAKQAELLDSDTHLLEIDFLRGGKHTIAAPASTLAEQTGFWDYVVCLHRAGSGPVYQCWPFTLRDPLPIVVVPLTQGHPDIALNLPAIFAQACTLGPFARVVDYSAPPRPRLSPNDAAWAEELLRR
ncbi:DUF4058 family protein [Armatimonas rosea]|uniref:DUF4058 family protein n=1 Tax=Armatimonas rosea TaxID=685828 RepID=A0A7W9W9A4_ARMRO|nr:DUF4058 family protein [Armatimonas rosea]MBB6053071.1 hypothetical protein [Armatimonas rosea]